MVELAGDWHGEWKDNSDSNDTGMLRFIREGEYLKVSLEINSRGKVYDNITIRLFGNYFQLIIHDKLAEGPEITVMKLELEIFNSTTLLGQIIGEERKAYFTKIKPPVNA